MCFKATGDSCQWWEAKRYSCRKPRRREGGGSVKIEWQLIKGRQEGWRKSLLWHQSSTCEVGTGDWGRGMMGKEGIYQREFIPAGRQAEQKKSWLISTLIRSALTRPRVCVRCLALHVTGASLPRLFTPSVCVLRVCVHSTEVDVRRPGQQRLPSVPGLGHLPGGPHHLLSGIHPDSGSAGCRYDKTRDKETPAERDTIHRALFKKTSPRFCR